MIVEGLDECLREAAKQATVFWEDLSKDIREALNAFDKFFGQFDELAEEVYKPRPKPKRPQRKILLRYEPLLDARIQIYKYKRR